MERPKSDHQAIHFHDDHVEHDRQDHKMMFSVESREEWQGSREAEDGRWVDSSSLRQDSFETIPSRRARVRSSTRLQMGFFGTWQALFLLIASLWIMPTSAVLVKFQNCLSDNVKNNSPLQLQLVPLVMNAAFNTTDPMHNLNVTVWTNVTGSTVALPRLLLPNATDPYWSNNDTSNGGKIAADPLPDTNNPLLTTLFNKVGVLTYTPFNPSTGNNFCEILVNGTCPLGPNFKDNLTSYHNFPSYGFENNFYSTYAFTSFTVTLLLKYGDPTGTPVGCVSANLTPDIGSSLSSVVKYIPVVILLFVGFATAFAGIFSPWGTTDIFRWTTNYGRDADLLRLVTPGFGDCLQYIQFVALTGGLTLNYPGFYQPIVSKVSWSALMFNQSFVSGGNGTMSLVDGIYVTNGTYGLDQLRQLVGMSEVDDVWAGMAVWLLVILGASMAFIQIGFFVRWAHRHINNTQEEDLRAKNMPFSVGNVIRIVFNYLLLPIVALSMFQLVVAGRSPAFAVGLAVVMLVLVVGFACWLLFIIASTRPKSYLFDDLPTVLLYGSLYNTYSDNAAPFALIPLLLTFVRGIAIGAVQPSGIAQLVLLAICEVITILTLHAFRPFHSPTSMNAFHTFFAVLRFATILLMISFAPSLGVAEGPKGWIGYAILLMHAIVLIFGFLLNAIQTIVEVAARMAGAGGDESGATRGGLVKVFGMRQLSRRLPRRDGGSRQSQLSSAAMIDSENDRKSYMMDSGRLRSQSAGSAGVLLGRASTGLGSIDAHDNFPPGYLGSGGSSHAPTTPGEPSTFSFLPSAASPSGLGRGRAAILGLATTETADPYYRPPRLRRPTLESFSPGAKSRRSWASRDGGNKRWSEPDSGTPDIGEEGLSISGRNTPIAPQALDGSPGRTQADYTTREVDFYYGVRGPALNANIPSRRIKTGPADPTGPAASAAGWFKGLFGGKTKEKGKGFEVVRSARMPPGMAARNAPGAETPPEGVPVATAGGIRNGPIESDDESVHAGPSRAATKPAGPSTHEGDNLVSSDDESLSDDEYDITRISDVPPTLGLDIPDGGIELPSRFPSKATSKASSRRAKMTDVPLVPGLPIRMPSNKPNVPRKSSRRKSQSVDLTAGGPQFSHQPQRSLDSRLPFDRTNSKKRLSDMSSKSGVTDPLDLGNQSVLGKLSADIQNDRPTSVGYVNQHSIRTVNPSANPHFLGSSAEVVDGRHSGASSMENPR